MIYGIDLGTSNCLAAQALQFRGKTDVHCLMDDEGQMSFPSVVYFQSEASVKVGKKAQRLLSQYPDQTVELVKTRMGKTKEVEISLGGKPLKVSPQYISAVLLKHLNVLHGNKITEVVLTVPAYFDDNQKAATREASEIAGIKLYELIEEPSAAIMYHLYDMHRKQRLPELQREKPKNYLVFDFGGGTLDLSLIRIVLDQEGNIKPTVLEKDGDQALGGNIIDLVFARNLIDLLNEEVGDAFVLSVQEEFTYYERTGRFRREADQKVKEFILNLKNTVEYAKIQLSTKESTRIEFGRLQYKPIEISRQDFEEGILEPEFRDWILEPIDSIKRKCHGHYAVDEVVLVGGASQIPYIKKLIVGAFPELKGRITVSHDYDNAVAKGAAILGAIRSGITIPPFGLNRCHNSVSHDILVEHVGKRQLFVKQGTPYPFDRPREISFKVGHALETSILIDIKERVRQYDQTSKQSAAKELSVKRVKFYHPFFYTNDRVTLTLEMDRYGLLNFCARHEETQENIEFRAERRYELNGQELEDAQNKITGLKEI